MNTHTETKHTPGPWVWFIRNGDRGRIRGKPTRYSLHNDSRSVVIAPDYSEFNGEGVWESWIRVSDADARLIAAAPDLLDSLDPDALEAIADELFGTFQNSARADSLRVIARKQRAAIAKATGGAQ